MRFFTGLFLSNLLVVTVLAQSVKKLRVEPNHSTIEFSIPISGGITRVTGKFMEFEILLDLVDSTLTKSTISATIKTASINTGIAGRDEHLRTADFFEVEKYPEITFVTTEIKKTKTGFLAIGDFTMHGVTKKMEIPFVVTGVSGANTIGFSGTYNIKRSDYGVGTNWKHTADDKFLGDDVDITLFFWTRKVKS